MERIENFVYKNNGSRFHSIVDIQEKIREEIMTPVTSHKTRFNMGSNIVGPSSRLKT